MYRKEKNMKYRFNNGNIFLETMENFSIKQTLECGQVFRFKFENGRYILVAKNKVLEIEENEKGHIFYNTSIDEFENIWMDYFDFKRDYSVIQKVISKDEVIKKAISYGKGIRILNQDYFETIISFIISQNNRIPMIQAVIENISREFGEKIDSKYYSFPVWEKFLEVSDEELRVCKTGFRSKYILDCVHKINDGNLNFEEMEKLDTYNLKNNLMQVKGIGEKVSDCIVLFAFGKREAFPVDVWIKRVMEFYYYDNKKTDNKIIREDAYNKFGEYGGYAQQYLFYMARSENIGK